MKMINTKKIIGILLTEVFALMSCQQVLAEITPDNTLDDEISTIKKEIINQLNSEIITGGARRGDVLLHSFSDFNIFVNQGAYFSNPQGVANIISRITGNNSSQIDGTLGVLGNANLFLINPNGIIFGNAASLDLNGSFMATTADSIIFPDYEYSTLNPQAVPLLITNIPIGLNFSGSNSQIIVKNDGFTIYQPSASAINPPVGTNFPPNGLQVKPGNSISLVAGNILFDGGVINTINSSINLLAIEQGNVDFINSPFGFLPTLNNNSAFGNLTFTNHSLILNNSLAFGSINIYGQNIRLTEGSSIILNNYGLINTGDINIFALGDVTISGTPERIVPDSFSREISGIVSSTFSQGKSADINLKAANLKIEKTGILASSTFSSGSGGNINLNIEKSVQVIEFDNFPTSGSLISTYTAQSGQAGEINLNTYDLSLSNGGFIVSTVLGVGKGGNINIEANSILAEGYNKATLSPNIIASFTASSGNGGDVNIKTFNLALTNGSRLAASTLDSGNAGSVKVFARNILISGRNPSTIDGNSFISSSGNLIDPITRKIFLGIDLDLSGKAGSVSITAEKIYLRDGGEISVKNDGPGDAGTLEISTNQLILQDGGILASTQGGNGGVAELFTNSLVLQNSNITASAKGDGKGGDINIDSTLIAGDTTSFISANAVQGLGGRININTQGLIFDPANITATSDRGAQYGGSVNINFSTSNFSTKSELAQNLIFKSSQISCRKALSALRNITAEALNMPDDRLEAFARANGIPMTVDANGKKTPWIKLQGWIPSGNGDFNTVAVIKTPPTSSKIASACRAIAEKD
jgi:filamentous hemagglutinin family protein